MHEDAELSFPKLAKQERLTKARVSQMMQLALLSRKIQQHLKSLHDEKSIQFFSVRKRRRIAALPSQQQTQEFARLKETYASKDHRFGSR